MRRRGAWMIAHCLCLALTLGADCGTARYGLDLERDEVGLRRTLRLIESQEARPSDDERPAGFPEERARVLEKMYGKPSADGRYVRSFERELPADLDGSGALLRTSSLLGQSFIYQERLRGEDQPSRAAERFLRGEAQWLELTQGWIEAEVGAGPASEILQRSIRERVIPDLCDIAFYRWLGSSELIDASELEARWMQLMVERRYFSYAELDTLDTSVDWVVWLRRLLEAQSGELDLTAPGKLAWLLADGDHVLASLLAHIARSSGFEAWIAARGDVANDWKSGIADLAEDEDTAAAEVLGERVYEYLKERYADALLLVPIGGFGIEAIVELTLALPEAPLGGNGAWDASTGRVRWNLPLHQGPSLAGFALAHWVEPAREFQVQHLGRVLLSGDALDEHIRWYDGLSAEHRAEWDRFVTALTPGGDLSERLAAFRFQGETDRTTASDTIAALLAGLASGTGEPAAP